MEQQIFADEAARADVPLPAVTLQTVGPTLQEHGTPWQQDFFLPRILAGEVHFAIGYTEPEAGTDLASLRTRAVRDGQEYVVDGQKIFTTGAHAADYIWLACRTDPDAPKHRGISILIVDTTDPGFSWTPIITHDGAHHVNATYYAGVRVPVRMRVGPENGGWRLITTQLNHERVMLGPAGRIAALHDRVRAWAAERSLLGRAGRAPGAGPGLGRDAGQRAAQLAGRVRARRSTWRTRRPPRSSPPSSSRSSGRSWPRWWAGTRTPTPGTAELMTWLDVQLKRNIVLTFGGGVNEVQRELIATAGLGLPRAPR